MSIKSYLKSIIIDQLVNFKRQRWQKETEVKVLISTNDYFTKESWENSLPTEFINAWDILYCRNKLDIIKHYPSAKICFLFSFGSTLANRKSNNKLIYFPFMGSESLSHNNFSTKLQFTKPDTIATNAIAEYCLSMVVILSRGINYAFLYQVKKKWRQMEILSAGYRSISKYTIGLLGVGKVGQSVAEKFAHNNCTVFGCDKSFNKESNSINKWFLHNDLRSFLKEIDILIITLPLTKETTKLIGLAELRLLGPSKYLINVSRGEIIDEKALLYALRNKIIAGAALDVFQSEPLSKFSPFYKLSNVIITPHIAGNINLFVKEIQNDFIEKVKSYLKYV